MGRRTKGTPPAYRRHKGKGRGYVCVGGKQRILPGEFNSTESRRAYRELIARWAASGGELPEDTAKDSPPLTVADLCADYLEHAESYYRRPDGTPTREPQNMANALTELLELWGSIPATEFDIGKLKLVRQRMIDRGLARKTIAAKVHRIRRVYRWAVTEGKVPASLWHELQALQGLRPGRAGVKETKPVRPVSKRDIVATMRALPPSIAAMVRFQFWTGARPGEVCELRPADIDRSGAVWVFRPQRHKTELHGKERVIPIGPSAQKALRPVLDRIPLPDPNKPVFSPTLSQAERSLQRRQDRRTPPWPSHLARLEREKAARTPQACLDRWSARSYGLAIRRACKRAGVEPWGPNRLRHAAATRLRRELGLEAARVVLGHSSAAVTTIYAEVDHQAAIAAMERCG